MIATAIHIFIAMVAVANVLAISRYAFRHHFNRPRQRIVVGGYTYPRLRDQTGWGRWE